MGVYIKGMEMPSGCISCDFCNPFVEKPYCRRLMKRVPKVTRLDNCPLVPVPPHGDLIDRDKLEKDIDKYIGGEESRSRFHHWVQVQRTVIPESKETHT